MGLSERLDHDQYDPLDHAQRLKTELDFPIQPGNTQRGYLQDLNRIRTELEDLNKLVAVRELIACLVNGLRVPEFMAERNFLVHNPQVDFDIAYSLYRKIRDTIVAGVTLEVRLPHDINKALKY